jgi:hypothetical protein
MLELEQFCERFPKYALFASHWEPKELKPVVLPAMDLEKIEVLYLFDRAVAYEQLKDWLHEKSERRLVLLEPKPGTLAALFHQETTLFADTQVDIELSPFDHHELVERYPVKRIEVIGNQKLRLALLRKTTLAHALFTDRLHGYQPFENFVRNVPHLKHAFYANGLKDAFDGIPAIVCGAGPSLQTAIPLLKKLEGKALVIAGGSAVAALSAQAILPHFGMAIDPNLEEYRRFRNSFAFECPLLFSTRLFPGVFRTCNGPFGYFRSGIGGVPELWMEEELGLTDPLLGENLSEESTSVTPICLAFAQHVGCKTIILAGVDLAYTGGKRYVDGISDEKEQFQKIEEEKSAADRILRRKDKRGKFVNTAVRWVMEAAAIAHFAKKHPEIRWINATEGGLRIDGLEEMELKNIPFLETWDLREMVKEQIALHPMPENKKDLLGELRESLERMIGQLEIMANEKSGSKALAEFEMKEELVASILFYDMEKVLQQSRQDKWPLYLKIARKYFSILQPRTLAACSGASGH